MQVNKQIDPDSVLRTAAGDEDSAQPYRSTCCFHQGCEYYDHQQLELVSPEAPQPIGFWTVLFRTLESCAHGLG